MTPVAVGGPSGTVDITEEVERRSPPAQPAASPASMSLPGGSGPEPGCRIHLVGETGAKRCAYPVAVVLQALATIREGVR